MSSVRRTRRHLALPASMGLLLAACGPLGDDVIKVTVINTNADPAHKLTEVKVIDAGDKYIWHSMAPGRVASITLVPKNSQPRQLALTYAIDGQEKEWKGPKFDGPTPYNIEIKIDGQGAVSERHCSLPCELK